MAVSHLPAPARPASAASPRRRRGLFGEIGRRWADYVYVAPSLLVMLVVIGWPVVYTIYVSFFNTTARNTRGIFPSTDTYVGFDNYQKILSNEFFWRVTKTTVYWTVGSTAGAFVLGFGAALVVQREFIGRGVVRAILLIPWVISAVAAAYVWKWFLHSDYGMLSGVLMDWGVIDRNLVLLDSIKWVLPSLIVVNVWKEFPFVMIMMLAGLQTVPDQLMRAARVDGANAWSRFWHITVPHLRGIILITTLLLFVANLNSFTLAFIMTGGAPANASQLWIMEIYKTAFQAVRVGEASAFSVILFVIMLLLGYFYVRALTGGGQRRVPA